ncbi:SpoIID/LytB domain-containing protein [Nocardioides panaciterrulae]|uniref:SpoIID/LytB domain protein n=1 Tax=Nocardioides panaciterrulae TaxID=661492 RepID=A0A7Y9E4G8_9ACTN|nr:SpoIID/LytB domain-containing protein [Nocardioides panaciterrulae]NYD40889.1 SpoIID/LytB domain protein [Nocardioides panaciterrulae]
MRSTRRRLTPAAVLLAVAATTVGLTAPSYAAGDTFKVPAKATVVVKGHGYGHGHGMSQYGAEGAARQGLGYRDIAKFYYQGTSWGETKGAVSVHLSVNTSNAVVVLPRQGLAVRDLVARQRTVLPDNGATRWRLAPGPKGGTRIGYRAGGKWHAFATAKGAAQFAAHGQPITLMTSLGERPYRGRLRSVAPDPGTNSRDTVNLLSMENYVKGVVPLEMPALWSADAVRTQAVAARTYAAYERDHPISDDYQICDTGACQVYGGVAAEHPASNAAVDATRHEVLTADGEPAFTQFGASSGGWTSAGSVPYLGARQDPYDGWGGNPVHSWKVSLSDATLEQAWPAIGNLRRIVVTSRDGNGDWGGRLQSLVLVGSDGRVPVSGDTFRAVLGLRSTWATFKVNRTSVARPARGSAGVDWSLLAADLAGGR